MRLSAVLEGWIAETRRLFPISVEREASGWDALERICVAATNLKSSDLGALEAQHHLRIPFQRTSAFTDG
jgi:hypothetical protein